MANRVLLVVVTAVAICPVSSLGLKENRPRLQRISNVGEQVMFSDLSGDGNLLSHQDSNQSTLLLSPSTVDPSLSETQYKNGDNSVNEIPQRVNSRPLKTPRDEHTGYEKRKTDSDLHARDKIQTRPYLRRRNNKQFSPVYEATNLKSSDDAKTRESQNYGDSRQQRENELIQKDMEVVYKPSKYENEVIFSGKISHHDEKSHAKVSRVNPTTFRNPSYGKAQNGVEGVSLNELESMDNIIQHRNEGNEHEHSGTLVPDEVSTFLKAIQQRQLAQARARMGARKSPTSKSNVSQESTGVVPSQKIIPPGLRPSLDGKVLRQSLRERKDRTDENASHSSASEPLHVNPKENYPMSGGNIVPLDEEHQLIQDQDHDNKTHQSSSPDNHPSRYSLTDRQHDNSVNKGLRNKASEPDYEKAYKKNLEPSNFDDFKVQHRQQDGQSTKKFGGHERMNSRNRSSISNNVPTKTQHYQESQKISARRTNILPPPNKTKPRAPKQSKKRNHKNQHFPKFKNDDIRQSKTVPHDFSKSEGKTSVLKKGQLKSDQNDSYKLLAQRKDEEQILTHTYNPKRKHQQVVSSTTKTNHETFNLFLKPHKTIKGKTEGYSYPKVKEIKGRQDYGRESKNHLKSNTKYRPPNTQEKVLYEYEQNTKEKQPTSSKSNWSRKRKEQTLQKSHTPSNQVDYESKHPMKNQQQAGDESHRPLKEQVHVSHKSKSPLEELHVLKRPQRPAKRKGLILSQSETPLKRQQSQVRTSNSAPTKRHQTAKGSNLHQVSEEPLKLSSSRKDKKKKNKSHGFTKSHKSAYKEAKGHEEDEHHTVKEGHKKLSDEDYDQDHKENQHKKGSLHEDSAHHGQYRKGHYEKGDKGIIGHKKGSSKRQQKGHNNKGSKEVRHSKEYMVQKKHYKDVDNKEYYGDHDHLDKFFEKFKKGVFDGGSFLGDKHHKGHHEKGHHKHGHHHHHDRAHKKHEGDEGHHHHHSGHRHDETHNEKHEAGDDGGGH